ncbi:hypothetical protein J2741_001252 [Methanolinea mesophila]|uniref:VWA domain-containing protein n=1 Tax=Methanolinea mesophila TaxID=547055 RepID=UPI001AEA11A8|nr:VWA domain-containing protein [Methanolinea mesophila]MBP1928705.1 hypothetical protein [Methanolinea mesophila]
MNGARLIALGLLAALLLLGSASALVPDQVLWGINKEWVVANGSDTAIIQAFVTNQSAGINGLAVMFSVNNSVFGTLNPTTTITSDGAAETVFRTGTKSGVANITATIFYRVNQSDITEPTKTKTWNYLLNIDHAPPFELASYTVPSEIQVGSAGNLTLFYTDRYGNPVDNRHFVEEVYFEVSSPDTTPPAGMAHFTGANPPGTAIQVLVDGQGRVNVQLIASTTPGTNVVLAHPVPPLFGDVPDRYFFIQAVANATPVSLTQFFNPEGYLGQPPRQYADGVSLYQIVYLVQDRFGNGVQNSPIRVTTSIPGEEQTVYTNQFGQALLTYGPKTSIGHITVSAQSLANQTLQVEKEVWFVSQQAVDMQFSAQPESMPSRDVLSWAPGELRAKVIDENGNPVEGEPVTFSLGPPIYNEPYNVTSSPSLSATSALSDADGFAVVNFIPGGFSVNSSDPLYDPTATGEAVVTAHWENTTSGYSATNQLTLSWKNYPYLSITALVSPETVNVSDVVEVFIQLRGDGWALQPDPIDVILTTDRSGSMLYDNPDRMYSVREAGKVFLDNLSEVRDRAGLVSFGMNGYIPRPGYNSGLSTSYINNVYVYPRTYDGYATYDRNLTNDFPSVKSELDLIVPDYATPMREAIRLSIERLNETNRPKAIKAIVLLSDGDYNFYGDPLARGTGYSAYSPDNSRFSDLTTNYYIYPGLGSGQFSNQNMSVYAKNSGIKIYTIAFANSISSGGRDVLQKLALFTGGKYYEASATNIADVYTAIAGELRTEAGVNTQMDLDYGQVEVNNELVAMNETYRVFDYIGDGTTSTRIHSYNDTTTFVNTVINQSSQWNNPANPYHLFFDVGTVRLGQVWEATYKLRVLVDGNINVFGPLSTIVFNNGESTLPLPATFITAVPGQVTTGITPGELNITNVTPGSDENQGGIEYVTWTWDRHYTGVLQVTEIYHVSNDGGQQWIQIGTRVLTPEEANQPGEFSYPLVLLPPGEVLFRVVANAIDAPGPVIGTPPPAPPAGQPTQTAYIHLI